MAQARRLGVAVAGCGGISNCHTYALTQIPAVRLVATVDVDEKRALDFKSRFGAEIASTSIDEVLGNPAVDAVVITTANDMHAPLTLRALEAGKHVLVQKPMALTLDEADRMIATAERVGKKLMVSFYEFFHPAFARAKQLVEQGVIGDVFFFKAIMAWYGPNMDAWRFDPKVSGGGILMDGHVHHIAYFLHLLGSPEVESVYSEHGTMNSTARVEDTGVTLVRTARAIGEISGSNRLLEPNATGPGNFKEHLEIYGSKGTIKLTPTERPSLRVYAPEAGLPEGLAGGWVAPKLASVPPLHQPYPTHFNPDENPWTAEHQHFVDACLNDGPLVSDGRFGRKVQEVLAAGYLSGREGRRVTLPLVPAAAR
jgi:myo-inositol 2-dehydrogenase/D-chiro-inositol 1-dehydrogenase